MSSKFQSSGRALWSATCASRLSGTHVRHIQTSTYSPLISPKFPSKPSCQRLPSIVHKSLYSDLHANKRRKYSSAEGEGEGAAVSGRNRNKDAFPERRARDVQEDTDNRPERPFSESQRRSPRRRADYEDDSLIVTSSKKNLRDKDGRPWDVQGAGDGKKKNKGKQNRLELRDLAVKPKKRERWQEQKDALNEKFGEEGWSPRKKLSPDAMEGIRTLHEQDAERWSTPVLAEHFKVSPEAIRRILKSKWKPTSEQMEKRRERWARRHDRIWDLQSELGLRPQRTKDRAVEDPDQFEEDLRAKQILDNARNA